MKVGGKSQCKNLWTKIKKEKETIEQNKLHYINIISVQVKRRLKKRGKTLKSAKIVLCLSRQKKAHYESVA